MKKISSKILASLVIGGTLAFGAVSCTDKFEDFNTNPDAPTPDQMEGDFASTASLLGNMIPMMVQGQENNFQMLDQMCGYDYGRMIACSNHWGSDQYFGTYNPLWGWSGSVFDTTMPNTYTPFFMIRDLTDGSGLVYWWADMIRIFATMRVSDCYGPVPFSKIGTGSDFAVAYDDMPTLYSSMLAELDKAIAGMKEAVNANASLFADADYIYSGDVSKWITFANTLKLRLAMRLVNVEPALAQATAEAAVNDAYGVISTPDQAAWSTFLPGGNSFHKVSWLWSEARVSADLQSYLQGYSDPRLAAYAVPDESGNIVCLRNGIFHANNVKADAKIYSMPNVNSRSPLLCISASEAWFCRAEGALRGWNMGGTAKELYERGVRVSFEERVTGADVDAYLASEATPADYVDPYNSSYNHAAMTTISPKYDENATFQQNLERIMVQKWIGNYPNGWETWTDFRRTNYPKFFPVVSNMSTAGVSTQRGMRRLPYPQSEFNTNEANVKAAQAMLGGPDTGATDLWWAIKN